MFFLVVFCSKETLDYQGLFPVKPPFRVESTRIAADEVTDSPEFLQLPKVKLRPTLCLLEFPHGFHSLTRTGWLIMALKEKSLRLSIP